MALEDDKERKLVKAVEEDLSPRGRTSNGAKDERDPSFVSVGKRHLFPGALFGLSYFPKDRNGVSDDSPYVYTRHYDEVDFPDDDRKWWGWRKLWRVRLVTTPVGKQDWVLVQRTSDHKLGVVKYGHLKFITDDCELR